MEPDEMSTGMDPEEVEEERRTKIIHEAMKPIMGMLRGCAARLVGRAGIAKVSDAVTWGPDDGGDDGWSFDVECTQGHLIYFSNLMYLPADGKSMADVVDSSSGNLAGNGCHLCKEIKKSLPGTALGRLAPGQVDWEFLSLERKVAGGKVDWLIPGIMERGRFISLFGPPKAGKSILALEWAIQMADDCCRVLYLDEENSPKDVDERADNMGRHLADLSIDYRSFLGINLDEMPEGDDGETAVHPIVAMVQSTGADVVIFDSWSKFFASETQTSDTSVLKAYRNVIKPLRAMGISIIRLDHTGHAEAERPIGTSQKKADIDHSWLIKAEKAPGRSARRVTLLHTDNRTGRGEDAIVYQRMNGPLRHVLAGQEETRPGPEAGEDAVAYLVRRMDAMGIPVDWSNRQAGEALRKDGDRVTAASLAQAIRRRRG